jgi:multidrug efflux pump subunit AcrB
MAQPMTEPHLNFAGRLAGAFIVSKLTMIFILGITAVGILAIMVTPREENPQIVVPAAEVSVTLPGASALEVEERIVTPLEGVLSGMTGVDHTYGVAMNSVGVVTVQFKVGEDKEKSLVKLYDRVLHNRHRLPSGAGEPLVKSVDVDDVPILAITLASNIYDDFALKRIADRMVERLRSLEQVSVVGVFGGRDREIRIDLDPERLLAFGISIDQARTVLATSNVSAPVGNIVRGGEVQPVFLEGFLSSVESVRQLIVGLHDRRPIYVGDIADVVDGPPVERTHVSRFAFGPGDARYADLGAVEMPAVTIGVAKKNSANAVVVVRNVMHRIETMRQNFIPEGVRLIVTRDDGKKANDAVNLLMEHLGIAVGSVFFLLLIFLGWKEALIVTVVVPLVLFITLAADLIGGVTINRVTLFSLILSLGLLVDAAIVVIENINRHYRLLRGKKEPRVTVMATNEVGNPTNLATLAVMLVFGSLFLVTGMPGDYFFPVAFNVPIAMAGSVVIAYIVAPWAARRWLKPGKSQAPEDPDKSDKKELLHRIYYAVITPVLDRLWVRVSVFAVTLLLLGAASLQPGWQFVRAQGISGPQSFLGVAMGFLPKDNKNTFNITIDMPETTPLVRTDRVVREIGRFLGKNHHVANYQSWVGKPGVVDFNGLLKGTGNRRGPHIAEIRVNLTDKSHRSVSSIKIVRDLREHISAIQSRYPGSDVHLVEDPPGPPVRATVLAELYGPDLEKLRKLSERVSDAFNATYDMVEVQDTEPADVYEHRIVVDKEKAALSGVSTAQIAQALRTLYDGDTIARIHLEGEKNAVPVRVRVPRRFQVDPTRLDRVFVGNVQGHSVPLSELVEITPAAQDRPILHKDNERVTFVGGELTRTAPVYAVLDLDRRLDGLDLGGGQTLKTGNLTLNQAIPDTISGYQLLWNGEMRLTLDTYRDMIVALAAALALVLLLLVAYYKSFHVPLIAMSAVPLSIIGVFPGHWIMGADFSATSMVGIIALAGVVVRNSLLIIDFIQDNLRHGMGLQEAVKEAGAVRLRPILLTTLAIVFGSAVMLADPVFGGLAISLIFGTVVSTALTLIIVPALFYMTARNRAPRQKYV